MKRLSHLFILSLSVLFFSSCLKKAEKNSEVFQSQYHLEDGDQKTVDFIKTLETNVPALLKKNRILGAVVAVIHQGQPVWYGAFGYADAENNNPMKLDNICRVESISKSVTTWGVLKLVQEGMIDLDVPVITYLKNWSFPPSKYHTEKITVRHLLAHSSGLKLGTIGMRYLPEGERPSLHSTLTKDAILFQEPGKSFSYSNVGFNLLELLIEEVSGKDFGTYMREVVFNPLGMIDSEFGWSARFESRVPNGYDLENHSIPPYIYPDRAAGGMFATIGDLTTFAVAGMPDFSDSGRKILHEDMILRMYQVQAPISGVYSIAFPSYGLGHFLEDLSNGRRAVSHGGQGSGWMTHFHSIPESGDAIIILTNSQRSWPFFAEILSVWGDFLGVEKVGMSVISFGNSLVWILLFLIGLGSLLFLFLVFYQLKHGRRQLKLRGMGNRWPSIFKFSLGWLLIGGLIWANSQPYLFIEAVFPGPSPWLGGSILLLAFAFISVSILPKNVIS
ncbi:serine hydrolase domain-containing protein [Lunatibacter salilacus]|uniref:serine hydrolase domain-containing protein n=1 Tax=Lunatibacter salilacus TaxID=2483804 RepID=UPI00131B1431|nr:serine hydrolase domain-containing protein [Lunatibacter salilacus]